jgi:hypothetical protein
MLLQVAGDLLKQYQEKFKGGAVSVTWNYLRDSMSTYLSQPNAVTARWEGEDHLRDPNFQLDAFRVSHFFTAIDSFPMFTCGADWTEFLLSTEHLDCYIVLLLGSRSIARHLEVLGRGIDA